MPDPTAIPKPSKLRLAFLMLLAIYPFVTGILHILTPLTEGWALLAADGAVGAHHGVLDHLRHRTVDTASFRLVHHAPAAHESGVKRNKQKGRPQGSRPFVQDGSFAQSLSVSKKSFIRAKKPVDSGLFSFDESCSNS